MRRWYRDELLLEDILGSLCFPASVREIGSRDGLQVVNVIEKNAVKPIDLGIDISRARQYR